MSTNTALAAQSSTPKLPSYATAPSDAPKNNIVVVEMERLLLVQDKRPKDLPLPKGTEKGDLVLSPSGANLGKTLNFVPLVSDHYFLRVGNTAKFGDPVEKDGQFMWKAHPDKLTTEQKKDTVWQKGADKTKPDKQACKAQEVYEFVVAQATGDPSNPKINEGNYGPIVLRFKSTAGKDAGKFLAREINKFCANPKASMQMLVFTLSSRDSGINDVQAFTVAFAGTVGNKATYDKLVESAKFAQAMLSAKDGGATAAPVDDDQLPPF